MEKQQLSLSCSSEHYGIFLLPWCWQPDDKTEQGAPNGRTIPKRCSALSTVEADSESQNKPVTVVRTLAPTVPNQKSKP